MKFSVSEIFTFCCQSCKKLYVCWRSIIRLLAFYVCWRSIIRLRVTYFERFYVCWRSIIRLLAFYVCWRSIIRLLAFYVCRRFTFARPNFARIPPAFARISVASTPMFQWKKQTRLWYNCLQNAHLMMYPFVSRLLYFEIKYKLLLLCLYM